VKEWLVAAAASKLRRNLFKKGEKNNLYAQIQ